MPVVRFLKDFDWKPTPSYTIAYRAGTQMLVTTACSRKAVAKGRAELVNKPRRRKQNAQDI